VFSAFAGKSTAAKLDGKHLIARANPQIHFSAMRSFRTSTFWRPCSHTLATVSQYFPTRLLQQNTDSRNQ
jgi:hypothetical protein